MAQKLAAEALEFFRKQGARGGRIGGAKSWASLTPAERSARAKKASVAGVRARRKKAASRRKGAKQGAG